MGKHTVGDDFHIATHAGDSVQQGQTIERAGRVVGDDDQWAIFRDLFQAANRNRAVNIEMFQHLFDGI